jgi:MarR family 2-MHQ and catechol resistance regulon transcriptional repressor
MSFESEWIMEELSNIDVDYSLWMLLGKARHAIFRAREKELNEYKVSPTQALILVNILSLGDKATTIKISRHVFREFHTVFEQLNVMENAGLVRKIRDFPRKNRLRFVLTEKGCEAYCQSSKRESIHKIMGVLSEKERQQLTSSLEKLLGAALKELNLPHFTYKSETALREVD